MNAIFYLLRTGCQWRLLPREFPPWPTVYYYFRRWEQESVWLTLLRSLYPLTRLKSGRRATPSVAIMDGQSVGQSFRRSKRSSRMPVTKAASSQGSSKPRVTSFASSNAVSGRSRVVGLTWIVERTFAWIGRYRRMSKDYEHRVQTSDVDRSNRYSPHA